MKKRILSLLLAVVMLIGLLPTVALAATTGPVRAVASGADSEGTTDNPVHVTKRVSEDGKSLTLEAYVTNPLEKKTTEVPVDVVLVLDISNSMDDAFNPATYSETYDIQTSGEYYYRASNGDYYRAYYCDGGTGVFCDGGWYTQEHYIAYHYGQKLNPKTSATAAGDQFYVLNTKLKALKEAATAFINNAATVSKDSRIAIVSFADTASEKKGLTAISSETGKKELIDAVNGLKIDGGTDQGAGLAKAKSILDARETKNPSAVLLFTDGDPTGNSGFDFKDGVAGKAVNTAKSLKDGDTIIFTVAVNDKADPTQDPENFPNNWSDGKKKLNKFLHAISSNYPNANAQRDSFNNLNLGERKPNSKYYRDATDEASLLSIFTSVSEEVSKLALRVDEEAVLSDALSGYFTFDGVTEEDTSKIIIKKQTLKSYSDETGYVWNDPEDLTAAEKDKISVTVEGKTLKITGFSYEDNAITVYEDASKPVSGAKLVVTIPITPDLNCTTWDAGTQNYDTNAANSAGLSGYYYKTDKEKNNELSTKLTESPTAPVKAYDVTYTSTVNPSTESKPVADPTDERHYIPGQTVTVLGASSAEGWTFDGWNAPDGVTVTEIEGKKTFVMGSNDVNFTGTWTKNPTTATVTINKEFAGNLPETSRPSNIKITVNGQEMPLNATTNSFGTINLPVGEYTITEEGQNVEGYNCTTSGLTFEVTQADIDEGTKTITITNTYTKYEDAGFNLNSLNITKVLTGDGAEDLNRIERTFYVDVYPSDKDMNYDATKKPVATGKVEWTKNGENKFTFDKTLTFDHADTFYFVLREQKSGVVGMHYDDGAHGFGYFLTIVVTANEANTGYEATGTLTGSGEEVNTITNKYAKPTKETLTTSHIYGLTNVSVDGKAAYDWLDEAAQNKQSVLMFPDEGTNKLTVDKSVDKIALAYRVTVKGDTGAVATVKDDSAIYVQIARGDPGKYDVAVNEDGSITVTFHKWNEMVPVDLYFIKIVERGANGEFPSPVVNTATVGGKEIDSDPTYINDKTPGGFDFSDIILKDLYVTGDQNFPSSLTFQAKLKLKYFTNVDMSSALSLTADNPTVKDENDTVSEAFPAGWEETLYATFTPDDVKFDAHNTTSFTAQDGSHLFLNFPAEGLYFFSLEEIDDKEDGVKYDSNVYGILVLVGEDRSGKLTVDYVTYGDWKGEDTIGNNVLYDGPINGLTGEKITFYNEVDTGDIPYYPIIPILPTVKDEGKLNKTDHFAYIIGYPDGTVHPNGEITRAEVATIFFRLLKDDVRNAYFTSYNTYSDVKLGKWYNNPISTMSALGIINGYPDGTFRPDAPITRAEFAAIAARFDETATRGTTTFVDVYGHWAADEIAKAYGNDWIKGYPDGTFRPDRNITRAEAMTLINRVLDRAPESPADLLPDMNKWSDNMDTTKWYYLAIQEATNSHDYTRKTFDYEMWKRMLLDPDWSRYER